MDSFMIGKFIWTAPLHFHCHKTWEVILNVKGSGTFYYDGGKAPFAPGSIVCIPPRISHNKETKNGFCDIWLWSDRFPQLDRTKPTFLEDGGNREIAELMNVMYSVQHGAGDPSRAIEESLLDCLQQMILDRSEKVGLDSRVEEVISRMTHHFQDPNFSVEDCLKQGGYCSDYMRRLFRKETGKTPVAYFTELRMNNAKKLLATRTDSHYTVAEIGERVGYQNLCYFSRQFKKFTGISPGAYKG